MFFECFRAHFLQITEKPLPLHRVFHSIRFKVNKRLGYGGIPFFMSFCKQPGKHRLSTWFLLFTLPVVTQNSSRE